MWRWGFFGFKGYGTQGLTFFKLKKTKKVDINKLQKENDYILLDNICIYFKSFFMIMVLQFFIFLTFLFKRNLF